MFEKDGNPNTDFDMLEDENRIESVFTDPGKNCHEHKHNSVTGFAEIAD